MSDCDAGGNNPPTTDNSTDTVRVCLGGSGAEEKIYHSEPEDCTVVDNCQRTDDKRLAMLTDDWMKCRYCADDYETGGVSEGTDPGATRKALLEADADDLRTDGGQGRMTPVGTPGSNGDTKETICGPPATDPATAAYIHILRGLNLRQREIADILDISQGAVRNHCTSAREAVIEDGADPIEEWVDRVAVLHVNNPDMEGDE